MDTTTLTAAPKKMGKGNDPRGSEYRLSIVRPNTGKPAVWLHSQEMRRTDKNAERALDALIDEFRAMARIDATIGYAIVYDCIIDRNILYVENNGIRSEYTGTRKGTAYSTKETALLRLWCRHEGNTYIRYSYGDIDDEGTMCYTLAIDYLMQQLQKDGITSSCQIYDNSNGACVGRFRYEAAYGAFRLVTNNINTAFDNAVKQYNSL